MNPLSTRWRAHALGFAWPTIVLALAILAGEAIIWASVLNGLLPLWVGSVVATVLAYFAFTVLHESVHGNIHGEHARWRGLGEALGWMSSGILFAAYPAFRVIHLQHHGNTNDPEKDPDHWVASSRWWSAALRCATILPKYYTEFFFGHAAKTRLGQRARRPAAIGSAVIASVLISLIGMGFGVEAIFLWVIPAWVAVGLLAFAFDWLPHHPHNVRGRFRDTRVLLAPGLTFLMAGQNYHLIHHLYPRIPFYRYGRCFHEIRPYLEEQGAPIVDVLPVATLPSRSDQLG